MIPSLDEIHAAFMRLLPPVPPPAAATVSASPFTPALSPGGGEGEAKAPAVAVAQSASPQATASQLAAAPASSAATAVPAAPAAVVPVPVPAPVPASPCQVVDPKTKGYHFDATVAPEHLVPVAKLLYERGFAIDAVTGVDWMAQGQMEVVYDFFHFTSPLHIVVRTRVPRDNPEVPTISTVFPGANWHERETHEFFGILFLGHPNLTPLLLPEDATYHPLRKDFAGAA